MAIPKKVSDRISLNLKRFQAILADAKSRDISESDTVVILGDMLLNFWAIKNTLKSLRSLR